MLYKVTPAMEAREPEKKRTRVPGQPRPKRKSAIYDSEGHEVLITLMCFKCRQMKPLAQFGLRKMADGAIRNQPWCRGCRSVATSKKKTSSDVDVATSSIPLALHVTAEVAPQVYEGTLPMLADEEPTDPALPAGPEAR